MRLREALAIGLLFAACGGSTPSPRRVPPPDRGPAEEVPPAPGALNRGVVELDVAGVQVIYKRRPANDIVVVDLILRGGVRNLTRETAGIEELALTVGAEGGTSNRDKDELAARLEGLGSSITTQTDSDYSRIRLSTIRPHFAGAWELWDDVLRNASFPEDQVALHKDRQLTSIRQIPDNPDRFVSELASEAFFTGHPYRNRQLGFLDSVEPLDAAKLRSYWRGLLVRDRALVVVVGDLEEAVLREKLEGTLGALPEHGPEGEYGDEPLPPVDAGGPGVRFEAKGLPTTYVMGRFAGPSARHEDYAPLLVGTNILSHRLFEEVRTKRNLTYAVAARLGNRLANWGYLYTTAQDPVTTVQVIFDEIARLQTETVSEKDLEGEINVFITDYFMDLQSNGAQADLLGHWEIVAGGREYADEILERVRRVGPEEVRAAAREYFADFRFGVVGPRERFDEPLYRSR